MNCPKLFQQFWTFLIFSCFTKNCNGEEPWTGDCRKLTEGYDLTEDYDATSPPNMQTKVSLITHIFDVSKVDDFNRLVTVRFATSYGWTESRINFEYTCPDCKRYTTLEVAVSKMGK